MLDYIEAMQLDKSLSAFIPSDMTERHRLYQVALEYKRTHGDTDENKVAVDHYLSLIS
jgi:hypothetical protein